MAAWVAAAADRPYQDAAAEAVTSQRARTPLAEIAVLPARSAQRTRTLAEQTEVRQRYEAARELIDDGEFERAVVAIDAALDIGGGSYELLYLLAQAKQRLGRFGEARVAALHAATYRPDAADVGYLLGRLDQQRERYEPAIAAFRSATLAGDAEPNNPRVTAAWFELGRCLEEAGYLLAASEAFAEFDRALWPAGETSIEPAAGGHRDTEVVAAILEKHPHGAIDLRLSLLERLEMPDGQAEAARWAVQSRPDNPYLQRLYVRTLLGIGRSDDAFEFCLSRLEPAPDAGDGPGETSATALLNLAVEAARAADRLDVWVTRIRQSLEAGGGTAAALEYAKRVARQLDESKAHAAAARVWESVCAAEPSSAESAWALAVSLSQSDELEAALHSLIRFVRANPTSADIPTERLAAWMRTFEQTDEFLRLVTELTSRADADFATHLVLGITAAAAGQSDLAERLLALALEDQPGSPLVHIAWGRMLLRSYRWDEAREHAGAALEVAPDLAAAHFLMAEASAGLDEHEQAEESYKEALKRRPDDVAYLVAFAGYCRRVGELLAAQRYFQQAWLLDPGNAEAIEELVDSYLEGGKIEIARDLVQQAEASNVPADTLRRIRTAMRFIDRPLQDEHLAELTRQIEEHPSDVRTALKLAAGLFLHQRKDEALAVVQRVLAVDPENAHALNLKAHVQLRRLELDEAIGILEELNRRYPRRAVTLRLLADAYVAEFRLEEARAALQRLLELDLSEVERQQTRAQLLAVYVDFSEFEPALALVREWVEEDPNADTWARAEMSVLLSAGRENEALERAVRRLEPTNRRVEEAAGRLEALSVRLRVDPDDAGMQAELEELENDLRRHLGVLMNRREEYKEVCMQAGRYADLEAELRAWIEEQPELPGLREWLIEALLAMERPSEALRAAGEFRLQSPADVLKVYSWRAQAYEAAGDIERAVEELTSLMEESFIRETPAALAQVRQQMILLLVGAGEVDQAIRYCDMWLHRTAESDKASRFEILMLKRFALLSADREDEVIEVSEELLELNPHEPGLNNDLGYTWVDRGQHLERALAMIKHAVASEPMNAAFLDSLGWAYYKMGDFSRARLHLSRAVRLQEGQDPVIHDHLGDAAYRLGDHTAARRHWEKSLELLSKSAAAERAARDTRLMAEVRAKLTALDRGETPAVAPTGAEQNQEFSAAARHARTPRIAAHGGSGR